MKPTSKLLLFAVLGALSARIAEASVIDPAQSDVPACLVACPAGDVVNDFVMRDFVRNARAGALVTPDFCGCPDFHLVPGGSPPYWVEPSGCEITNYTDMQGLARFPIQGAGACADFPIYIYGWTWGGPLQRRSIASVDLNGDLIVDAADVALVESKLGTSDRSGDFDCDSTVTSADVAFVNQHMHHHGHLIPTAVPASGPDPDLRLSRPPFPNPASGRVTFSVANPREQEVDIAILDLFRRRMAALWIGRLGIGETRFHWDGSDHSGGRASPGLYVVRLRAGTMVSMRLFTLLR